MDDDPTLPGGWQLSKFLQVVPSHIAKQYQVRQWISSMHNRCQQSGPLPAFVNKVLLEHRLLCLNHSHASRLNCPVTRDGAALTHRK